MLWLLLAMQAAPDAWMRQHCNSYVTDPDMLPVCGQQPEVGMCYVDRCGDVWTCQDTSETDKLWCDETP